MIKFDDSVEPSVREVLIEELKEYEQEIEMNEEEMKILHEWVASGNSPYTNGSYVCYEGGQLMDFVNALRFIQEEAEHLDDILPSSE